MQRPWRGAAYCLTFPGLFNLLVYRGQDNDVTAHNGMGHPYWLLIKCLTARLEGISSTEDPFS